MITDDKREIARYTPEERRDYEESVKNYRDYINTVDTAHYRGFEKGLEEGRAEGIQRVARTLKAMNFPIDAITKATGLTREEIERI